jgi:hypothetical protein
VKKAVKEVDPKVPEQECCPKIQEKLNQQRRKNKDETRKQAQLKA